MLQVHRAVLTLLNRRGWPQSYGTCSLGRDKKISKRASKYLINFTINRWCEKEIKRTVRETIEKYFGIDKTVLDSIVLIEGTLGRGYLRLVMRPEKSAIRRKSVSGRRNSLCDDLEEGKSSVCLIT